MTYRSGGTYFVREEKHSNIGGNFVWGNVLRTCDKSQYFENYHLWLVFIFYFLEMVKSH